ncbi:MAG: glycerate-2-kinase family protein, partial [Candidatus Mariimomonas ferrooxydans]
MESVNTVNEIFSAALREVNSFLAVKEHSDRIYSEFVKNKSTHILLIGFGKASCQMAKAVEESIGCKLPIVRGIIITKYGHAGIQTTDDGRKTKDVTSIKIYEAGHPLPDENGLKATEEAINLLKSADSSTLVICLISGGGSALFVSPYSGITLDEKQQITDLLLKAGADITELNAVRKHISKVKGGRLAEIAYPAKTVTLALHLPQPSLT